MPLLAVLGITLATWIALAVVLSVALLILILMRRIQRFAVNRLGIRNYTADMIRRVLMALVVVVAVIYIFELLELEVRPLIGGLGISGIIAAIALQPVIGNFIGSMFLHSTRAFRPGDEIESNGIVGTVIDISHRAVVIEDFDGNSVYIPNLKVLDSTLVNLTADDPRRTLIPFQVAYNTDLRVMQERVRVALNQIEGVADRPAVEVLVRSFGDSGINVEAQIWHPAEEIMARRTVSEAAIVIRETLAENDIVIPFPQLVVQPPPDQQDQ
jgi:small conductance mechanosensitive channel